MKNKLFFVLILFIAISLRFFALGRNPASLDWDEASLGYNAYSVLKTGRDEYGNFLPLSIRSFNDYKPPLYTYLTVVPVWLFGLNEFSVRFVSFFSGVIAVTAVYFLVRLTFKNSKLALLTAFFLSLSPWHLQFGRTAFEANIALGFFIIAVTFYLKGLKKNSFLILSGIMFAISLYAYHSPRLIIPVFVFGLTAIFRNKLLKKIPVYIVFLCLIAVSFLPILSEFKKSTAARFSSVSGINPDQKLGSSIAEMEYDLDERGDLSGKFFHNRRFVFAREILGGYLDHFNFDFLFLYGDAPGRHHAAGMGMLYFIEFPFVIIGILIMLKNLKEQGFKTFFLWFLIAPLASSLTSGTPHAVRAIFYLPVYQLFSALGFLFLLKINKFLLYTCYLLLISNIFYYLHQYYVHTPVEYAREWQFGYKQAVMISNKYYAGVDKIIVTYKYDQPYIFWLFYNKTDPLWYQRNWLGELSFDTHAEVLRDERRFDKYEFRNIDWEQDKNKKNVLLIGTPSEIPNAAPGTVAEIPFPDGTPAFRIVLR